MRSTVHATRWVATTVPARLPDNAVPPPPLRMHPWQTSHEPQFSRRTANRQNERKQFTHQRILALHLAEHSRWALARGWQAACDLTEGCEARNAFEAICGQVQPSKKAAHGTLDGLDTHPMQIEAGFKFRCLPTLD